MEWIFRVCNNTEGEWKVTKYDKIKHPKKGVFLIFEADQTLASYIYYLTGLAPGRRTKADLNCGLGKFEFKYKFLKAVGQNMENSIDLLEESANAAEPS